jgi:formate dehydrogenase major subunit
MISVVVFRNGGALLSVLQFWSGHPLKWTEPANQPDNEYPAHVNNRRILEHFHDGDMTYRVDGIRDLVSGRFVEFS